MSFPLQRSRLSPEGAPRSNSQSTLSQVSRLRDPASRRAILQGIESKSDGSSYSTFCPTSTPTNAAQ
ncbi:hypothetical protein [Breoghania sp.]|uniref:hypothetical protein n=1 Tax=Breoghania sp. TaxID=2065378 RepID=UPI002AAA72F5|nr:hypothetical protein [Breoghania sp.]